MNNLNTCKYNITYPLINRENNYKLNKKFLSVHANDRDKKNYPRSNNFSIKCPTSYNNIESIRLVELSIPNKIFNFSDYLKNNQFEMNEEKIKINNGFYTEKDIENYLNNSLNNRLINIKVYFLKNQNRFLFTSDEDDFSLNYYYDDIETYSKTANCSLSRGFLFDIGFNKSINVSKDTNHDLSNILYELEDFSQNNFDTVSKYLITDSAPRFKNKEPIYFEIDGLNNIYDELVPYPNNSNSAIFNNNSSFVKSAFFKIPFNLLNLESNFLSSSDSILVFFEAPLKRIQNLSFKFRYHDGTLVDLDDQDITFTLEINELINSLRSDTNVRYISE